MKKEELKNQIKVSLSQSLNQIEKLSTEALATGISTGLLILSGKKDKESSEELEKMFSHFASIHSYDQLGQEVRLLLADAKSSAPDLSRVVKEISQTKAQLIKRVFERISPSSAASNATEEQASIKE